MRTLVLMLLAVGCSSEPEPPLTVGEVEAIIEDAARCEPGDECVVVETWCCPRAINADDEVRVRAAHERLEPENSECLADCVAKEDLTAVCVQNRCAATPR